MIGSQKLDDSVEEFRQGGGNVGFFIALDPLAPECKVIASEGNREKTKEKAFLEGCEHPLIIPYAPLPPYLRRESQAPSTNEYSLVSLDEHHISWPHITKTRSELLGYCTESPLEVLRKAFKDFRVTSYREWGFFDLNHVSQNSPPIIGIGISSVKPAYGITGKIDEILSMGVIEKARRTKGVEDAQMILSRLEAVSMESHFRDEKTREASRTFLLEVGSVLRDYI